MRPAFDTLRQDKLPDMFRVGRSPG